MIVSLVEVKRYNNIDTAVDAVNDTLYTQLINEAENYINNYLRFTVASGTRIINFDYDCISENGTHYLINDQNVTAITSLKSKATPLDSFDTISSAYYSLITKNHLIYLYCESGFNVINELTYVAGYSTIPDVIKNVCIEMVSIKIKESGLGKSILGMSQTSENHNGVAITNQYKDLFTKWHNMLNQYRLYIV